ncbi:MAG: hypothetical protein P9L99_11125 [Candidatus Lernaella stagnicola]|nr:hypothetical protein [Candidatus Lernaella stagnicola]
MNKRIRQPGCQINACFFAFFVFEGFPAIIPATFLQFETIYSQLLKR